MENKHWKAKILLLCIVCVLRHQNVLSTHGCGRNTYTRRGTQDSPRSLFDRAQSGAWPWMVSAGFWTAEGWSHACGGSLIGDRHVLTAAHCVDNKVRTLRFGDLNIKNDSDNHSVQTRRVKEAVVHPLYAHPSSYHDVAVWTLDRPVQFTDNVGPVCLPGSPNIHVDKYEGDQVTLTGWGKDTINSADIEGRLRQVPIKIYSQRFCNETYSTFLTRDKELKKILPELFQDSIMCAGYEVDGPGSCSGDSGGPIVRFSQEEGLNLARYVQIGIVSGGLGGCGNGKLPAIYVRLEDASVHGFISATLAGKRWDPESLSERSSNSKATPNVNDLLKAAGEGDLAKVKELVQKLGSPDVRDAFNRTAAVSAAGYDRLDVLKYLHEEAHADMTIPASETGGMTIHVAAFFGHIRIVRYLVEVVRLPVDIRDGVNYTSLHHTTSAGHLHVVRYLVGEAGASLEEKNVLGDTPLSLLCSFSVGPPSIPIAAYLIEQGADLETRDNSDSTPLISACNGDRVSRDLVALLVHKGANVNAQGPTGATALMFAVLSGTTDIIRLLLGSGRAKVELQDVKGLTALAQAVIGDHTGVASILITMGGADAEARFEGQTCIFYAKSVAMARVLVDEGGADIHWEAPDGSTVLEKAALEGTADMVRFLLSRSARANHSNLKGATALMLAAVRGNLEVLKLLLRVDGIKVGLAETPTGMTALHLAALKGHTEVVRTLVEEGRASLTRRANNGMRAADFARQSGNQDTLEYILSKEANSSPGVPISDKHK